MAQSDAVREIYDVVTDQMFIYRQDDENRWSRQVIAREDIPTSGSGTGGTYPGIPTIGMVTVANSGSGYTSASTVAVPGYMPGYEPQPFRSERGGFGELGQAVGEPRLSVGCRTKRCRSASHLNSFRRLRSSVASGSSAPHTFHPFPGTCLAHRSKSRHSATPGQ